MVAGDLFDGALKVVDGLRLSGYNLNIAANRLPGESSFDPESRPEPGRESVTLQDAMDRRTSTRSGVVTPAGIEGAADMLKQGQATP